MPVDVAALRETLVARGASFGKVRTEKYSAFATVKAPMAIPSNCPTADESPIVKIDPIKPSGLMPACARIRHSVINPRTGQQSGKLLMTRKIIATGTRGKSAPFKREQAASHGSRRSHEPPSPSAIQLKTYEEAVSSSHSQSFPKPCSGFSTRRKAPPHIADKARSYAQLRASHRQLRSEPAYRRRSLQLWRGAFERAGRGSSQRSSGRALKLQPDADMFCIRWLFVADWRGTATPRVKI